MKVKSGDLVISKPVFDLGGRVKGPSVTYLFAGHGLVIEGIPDKKEMIKILHEELIIKVHYNSVEKIKNEITNKKL